MQDLEYLQIMERSENLEKLNRLERSRQWPKSRLFAAALHIQYAYLLKKLGFQGSSTRYFFMRVLFFVCIFTSPQIKSDHKIVRFVIYFMVKWNWMPFNIKPVKCNVLLQEKMFHQTASYSIPTNRYILPICLWTKSAAKINIYYLNYKKCKLLWIHW